MMRYSVIFLFWCCIALMVVTEVWAQRRSEKQRGLRSDCWSIKNEITLLDTVKNAMLKEIEEEYKHHDFIQTFGCAYEEPDIEQNSIRAVYRAIVQSIRNRKVTLRDDLMALLKSKPPRPDNLTREYTIYVNLPIGLETKPARYEIRILDLEAVRTIESSQSVWTRVITRFAYREDFSKAGKPESVESEFIDVMEKAQTILRAVEKKNFSKVKKMLNIENVALAYPSSIDELVFGDSMTLFDEINPEKIYKAVYLGKGIFFCKTSKDGEVICKFGEERLYGLRTDINSFRRTTSIYADLNYQAPEVILQCLFLKFSGKKSQELPWLSGVKRR